VPSAGETTASPCITSISLRRLRKQHHALRLGPDFPANREFAGKFRGIQSLSPKLYCESAIFINDLRENSLRKITGNISEIIRDVFRRNSECRPQIRDAVRRAQTRRASPACPSRGAPVSG
jgi:hypothetical protein